MKISFYSIISIPLFFLALSTYVHAAGNTYTVTNLRNAMISEDLALMLKIIKALKSQGTDLTAINQGDGSNLLHLASSALDGEEVIKALLDTNLKGKINDQDNHGETPLMIASRTNHINFVKALLEAGADVNLQDTHGKTAMLQAVHSHQPNSLTIVQLLYDAGANIDTPLSPLSNASIREACKANKEVQAIFAKQPGAGAFEKLIKTPDSNPITDTNPTHLTNANTSSILLKGGGVVTVATALFLIIRHLLKKHKLKEQPSPLHPEQYSENYLPLTGDNFTDDPDVPRIDGQSFTS